LTFAVGLCALCFARFAARGCNVHDVPLVDPAVLVVGCAGVVKVGGLAVDFGHLAEAWLEARWEIVARTMRRLECLDG